jgi:hypothetical protein
VGVSGLAGSLLIVPTVNLSVSKVYFHQLLNETCIEAAILRLLVRMHGLPRQPKICKRLLQEPVILMCVLRNWLLWTKWIKSCIWFFGSATCSYLPPPLPHAVSFLYFCPTHGPHDACLMPFNALIQGTQFKATPPGRPSFYYHHRGLSRHDL